MRDFSFFMKNFLRNSHMRFLERTVANGIHSHEFLNMKFVCGIDCCGKN